MSDKLTIETLFSQDLIYSIGLFFIAAGGTEHALTMQFARLITSPYALSEKTVLALFGTEIKVRLRQIQIFARRYVEKESATQIIKLCDKIRQSFDRRNELAHFVHSSDKPNELTLATIRLSGDGSLVPNKTYTAEQIKGFAVELACQVRDLENLLTAAGVKPLPKWSQSHDAGQSPK